MCYANQCTLFEGWMLDCPNSHVNIFPYFPHTLMARSIQTRRVSRVVEATGHLTRVTAADKDRVRIHTRVAASTVTVDWALALGAYYRDYITTSVNSRRVPT